MKAERIDIPGLYPNLITVSYQTFKVKHAKSQYVFVRKSDKWFTNQSLCTKLAVVLIRYISVNIFKNKCIDSSLRKSEMVLNWLTTDKLHGDHRIFVLATKRARASEKIISSDD